MSSSYALERSVNWLSKRASYIAMASLTLAASLTLWIMLDASGWKFSLAMILFIAWGSSPYVVLGVIFRAIGENSKPHRVASIIAAMTVLAFTALMYVDAMFIHVSSTSALIFIFAPMYLAVGGVLIFFLASFIGRKLTAFVCGTS